MTAMQIRATADTTATKEWCKIFPLQITENYTSSLMFMKQLTVVAVSTITYLRNALPEDSYVLQSFNGLKIRSLKNKCQDDVSQFLSQAITQAFDAIDKKYLHQLVLCFYEGSGCEARDLLEYYVFEYVYGAAGAALTLRSKSGPVPAPPTCTLQSAQQQTLQLLRTCMVLLESCPRHLPPACELSLRLYYNDQAPPEYQAPGYSAAAGCEDPLGHTYAHAANLGSVHTPFHKFTVRSYVNPDLGDSREAIASQNMPMMTQSEEAMAVDVDVERGDSVSPPSLQCACNNYDCAGAQPVLITCRYCQTQQHAACYGVTRAPSHCCVRCAAADPRRTPTDTRLAQITGERKRQSCAILRRILDYSSRTNTLSPSTLEWQFGLSKHTVSKLMSSLYDSGVIDSQPQNDDKFPINIIPEKLKKLQNIYFRTDEDMLERLVSETVPQSQTDPIGEVLSPIEKENIQNNSQTTAKLPSEAIIDENATLKQYREALNQFDDLPLSGDFKVKTAKRKASGKEPKCGIRTKSAKIKRK